MLDTALDYLEKLISYPSITPNDAECQNYLDKILHNWGFQTQRLDCEPVSNLWARLGNSGPFLVFAGHTDVVDVGNHDKWQSPPFELITKEGFLYGRGVADMKGAIAAMLAAIKSCLDEGCKLKGQIAFLITSGEEGNDYLKGTPFVMEALKKKKELFDYCLVGEPSCSKEIGDTIKVGRRGSLTGRLTVHGLQGHVAYPQHAQNAIHIGLQVIQEIAQLQLDKGNHYFDASQIQVTNLHAGTGQGNVIPGELTAEFNIRYSSEYSHHQLIKIIDKIIKKSGLNIECQWQHNGEPFLTKKGALITAAQETIQAFKGFAPELSTSGGTSDGRFIAPYGIDVIELGLVNKTIHQVNECISKDSLLELAEIYKSILKKLIF